MPSTALAADNASRAVEAYNAMQAYFYQPSSKLYREHYPFDSSMDRPIGYLWSFEEAAKATLCMYGLPGQAGTYAQAVEDRLSARESYWDGETRARGYRSYPSTGDRYYDDNDWVGSDLLQHHVMTSKASSSTALERAQGVFNYVQTGWEPRLPKPGGVRWVDAAFNGDRGTGSTGGSSKLAAHLYDATGRRSRSYLDWAIKAYHWTKQYLLSPANGLYWDNIRADGSVDPDQWIYNQGVLIGANVLLHRITGTAQYLTEAVRLADASLAFYGTGAYYSGSNGAYPGRSIFNAIFFRNLLMLYAVNRNPSYLQQMQAYAEAAWVDPNVRDPQTNLFRLNGESRYSLLDQAGMVQVYACLGWESTMYGKLT
ncbi:MAG: glycoside hydrolase family 76 protein [Chloroflexota bacterium]|nr:glycoside hydrolase family 76 protein [Chloroflexota bacterium]